MAELTRSGLPEDGCTVYYEPDKQYSLSNGDIITVTATLSPYDETHILSQDTKEYVVEGLSYLVKEPSDITEDVLATIQMKLDEQLQKDVGDCVDLFQGSKLNSYRHIGYMLYSDSGCTICPIFAATLEDGEGEYTAYGAYTYPDMKLNGDGTLDPDSISFFWRDYRDKKDMESGLTRGGYSFIGMFDLDLDNLMARLDASFANYENRYCELSR